MNSGTPAVTFSNFRSRWYFCWKDKTAGIGNLMQME